MFLEDNHWECWACGRSRANCGHHIFGRGHEEGCEKSPLNFAPLCNMECHLARHGYWMTQKGKKYLFEKTLAFLEAQGYTLTDEDNEFLKKYGLEITRLGLKV